MLQQNNGITMTGGYGWDTPGLKTVDSFARGSSLMGEFVVKVSNAAEFTVVGAWGDMDGFIGVAGKDAYGMMMNNVGQFSMVKSLSGSYTFVSTGVAYQANRYYKVQMYIGNTSGVSFKIYEDVNGDGLFNTTGEDVDLLASATNSMSDYTFNNKKFFSQNVAGRTLTIKSVSIERDINPPSAISDLAASPSNGQIGLSWTAPAANGAAITDYIIEYKLASEPTTWTTFSDGTSTTAGATVTGLTNGLSYDFRVKAVNSVGTAAASNTATATPALSVPSAPLSLVGTVGTSNQVDLTWSAPVSNGGASVTDYIIEYKLASEPTTWTTFSDGTSATASISVTGLVNGSSYNFRVKAVNSVGTGTASSTFTATPNFYIFSDTFSGTTIDTAKWTEYDAAGTGGTTGKVQQNNGLTILGTDAWNTPGLATVDTFARGGNLMGEFIVSSSSTNGFSTVGWGDIDWFTNAHDAYGVTMFSNGTFQLLSVLEGSYGFTGTGVSYVAGRYYKIQIYVGNTSGVTFKIYEDVDADGLFNSTGEDVDLLASATHSIASYSFNTKKFFTNTYSSSRTVTTKSIIASRDVTVPSAPTNLSGTPDDTQIGLTWTAGLANGAAITDYIIEYKLASEPTTWTTFSDGTSATASATVTGLTNGASYNFRVKAVNSAGTSSASSTASATPISATPTAPTVIAVSISGAASVGQQLTGVYTYADPNGNAEATSTFRWLRSDTLGGTYVAIGGATSINYTLVSDDLAKYIKFEVTPVASVAPTTGTPVQSSASGPIDALHYFNHILSTGQSLSTGSGGTPTLSTTQPYNNKMLSGTSLVPLIEGSEETPSSATANTLTALSPTGDFQSAVTRHGSPGTAYSGLKKGTSPYNLGILQTGYVKNAATALGLTDRVIGVTVIHGESDHIAGNGPLYESYLVEWQNDYDTDVKAITGQSTEVLMYTDQMSSHTAFNSTTSDIPIAQLAAAEDYPGNIVLVTPKYFLNYTDGVHLTNTSYRWLGEYYGKVINRVVNNNEVWRPLSPDSISRSGNIITADFHVPSGSLTFDTTLVTAKANMGFEYYDSTSSATISSVSIVDADTVQITLSGVPTGSNQRLRYAYTGTSGAYAGASVAGSAHGNLRDTDTTASLYGNTLYNWSVHFDKPITVDSTAPVISSVASTPATTTASITWATNELASSIVDYGLTSSYGTSTTEADTSPRVLSHTVGLTGLTSCTTYHYRVKSNDASLNLATGSDNTFTTTGCDTTAPIISSVSATPSTTSASITWITDEAASSIVDYGATSSYGTSTSEADTSPRVTSHTVALSGLTSCTLYHYRVKSNDASANLATGTDNTFTTTGCDVTAPIISSVASTPSTTTSSITWTTDELASSIVDYGLTSSYGTSTSESDTSPRVTSHTVGLTGLSVCTTYHYRVKSKDSSLNLATGSDNTFTTTGCDVTAPVISSVSATPSTTSVSITWTTDELASSLVDYGATSSYGTSTTEADISPRVLSHTVSLSGLTSCTVYHYRVKSNDASANLATGTDNTFTTSGCADTTAPIISSVSATPSTTSASITWTTDELASSIVNYGLTSSYGSSIAEADLSPRVTSHTMSIPSLVACTTYHYRVRSNDASANLATGTDNTFTTTGCTGSASISDQTSSNITTASGGTVTLTSGSTGIELDIPAGTTGSDAVYQIKSLNQATVFGTSGTPTGMTTAGGYAFDIKALTGVGTSVTSLSQPVEITLTYQDSDVSGIDESSLLIYRYDGSSWNVLTACVVNTTANTVTCTTSNFSVFSLFGTATVVPSSGGGGGGGIPSGGKTYGCTDKNALNYQSYVLHYAPLCKYASTPTTKTLGTPGVCTAKQTLTQNLKSGSRNGKYNSYTKGIVKEAKILQAHLNRLGFSSGPEDGILGPKSDGAIKRMQTFLGTKPDGYVGPLTRALINNSCGKGA